MYEIDLLTIYVYDLIRHVAILISAYNNYFNAQKIKNKNK